VAIVQVPYESYVNGDLPGVCVVSGAPTTDVFVYRVDVTAAGKAGGGRLASSIDAALAAIDVRRPRRVLVGRVPLDRTVQRSLVRRRRAWTAALVGAIVALITVAWIGAAWSPVAAVVAATGAAVAAWQRHLARRALPRPSVTHDDTQVTLDGVHPAFAAAVENR
jgi:hypothetical protein